MKADYAGCLQVATGLRSRPPPPTHSLLSWLLSSPKDTRVSSSPHPVGICGTELSCSIFSVSSVGTPKLKQIRVPMCRSSVLLFVQIFGSTVLIIDRYTNNELGLKRGHDYSGGGPRMRVKLLHRLTSSWARYLRSRTEAYKEPFHPSWFPKTADAQWSAGNQNLFQRPTFPQSLVYVYVNTDIPLFYFLIIYLAALDLINSCGMETLGWAMWDLVPWPGIKPSSLHWEYGVLATGPPGKFPHFIVINLHILKTINGIKKINKAFHSLNNIRFSDFSNLNSVKPEEFAFLNGMAWAAQLRFRGLQNTWLG